MLINLPRVGVCANILTNINVYTATQRKLAIFKKQAIGTVTSETAKIYQCYSEILTPIQTERSGYIYYILLISFLFENPK